MKDVKDVRDVNCTRGIAISEFYDFPVVSGDVVLTFRELQTTGVAIERLRAGDWFANIRANRVLDGFEIVTGFVVHQGVGATCIRLNATWDDGYWVAGDMMVLPIPNPWQKDEVDA